MLDLVGNQRSPTAEQTDPPSRREPLPRTATRLVSWLLLAAALSCLFFILHFVVTRSGASLDFIGPYTAGRIVRQGSGGNLYDLHLQRILESQFVRGGRFLPFDHPPFEAWLYLPLAVLSYPEAYLLWAGLNLLALALAFYFLPYTGYRLEADSRLVWLATCLPLVAGALVLGQDSLLLVVVFLFAFLALKRRRDVLGGLVLGAGLIRFEILLPFLFIFLLRRRWKLIAGFSIAGLAALFASLPLAGWGGLLEYAKILLTVGKTTGSAANGINVVTMPSVRGALAAFSSGAIPPALLFPLVVAGSLLLLAWAAWEFRAIAEPENPAFDLQFSFAVIAALLASYHLFAHELTPLILVAFLLLGYECGVRRLQALRDRPGTMLLLLFSVTMIGGAVLGFRDFSVLFVVLFGLLLWLAREPGLKGGLPAFPISNDTGGRTDR